MLPFSVPSVAHHSPHGLTMRCFSPVFFIRPSPFFLCSLISTTTQSNVDIPSSFFHDDAWSFSSPASPSYDLFCLADDSRPPYDPGSISFGVGTSGGVATLSREEGRDEREEVPREGGGGNEDPLSHTKKRSSRSMRPIVGQEQRDEARANLEGSGDHDGELEQES